jgi:segregation and condensation protein B
VEIRAVAGGYKMYTKPQHHDVVRRFIKSLRPPLRLSMPALETLAVIAYKQPVTAPEISEIRGVNTSGVISTLLDKKLITTAGRKEVMGRPILYKSSKEFLMRFGLSDLDELPSLKEFEALAREALGSDEGLAESGDTSEASLSADSMTVTPGSSPAHDGASAATSLDETGTSSTSGATSDVTHPLAHLEEKLAASEELREEEASATAEGMPSGELDEDPPAIDSDATPNTEAKSKSAGD